ncbi:hypothetical protein [Pinibacter aurantiacus]|uniref:Uncharacterized protein n=1 Tax=Pinibacter aurantiacus TaxID=2851599 RepID=A0A9E2W619_9BACT|nr:hypothetical protein [Pinibacter aurantiacus]MBV4359298.1 hypothetical protein [Pinibacter aurantiacus]
MKTTALSLITFFSFSFTAFAQKDLSEMAAPIVEEGKMLYRSEMASWYGTDLFLEKYTDKGNIGGYFSYADGDSTRCVFYSNNEKPKVLGTITFDSTYSTSVARLDVTERSFSKNEKELFVIREAAKKLMVSDTLFESFQNTSLNLIPIVVKGERKVYILTGAEKKGVVIFGNDYLLTFDKDGKVLTKKKLHANILPSYYGEKDGKKSVGSIHSHNSQTGDFITATDICTLMLYEKMAEWDQYVVVSEHYVNIWNCKTNTLTVRPRETEKEMKETM